MNRIVQGNLLKVAGAFIFLQSAILTLAPAALARSFDAPLRWTHWIAALILGFLIILIHREIAERLPDADPFLFPTAVLLSGWGLLTIWRLDAHLGVRQALWLGVSLIGLFFGLQAPDPLNSLRRYKYTILSGGFLLVILTLLFGANPMGFGPRLWLKCCGVYFQPSEPLKLLLIIFLAAYLADQLAIRAGIASLTLPTAVISGFGILLLLFQRDLGTASIFIALFTIMIYLASGRRRTLLFNAAVIVCLAVGGYYFIEIVHTRFDSWINPWEDSAGRSYQIIQGLLAVANGGIEGRGLGLGSPNVVPVAVSDFIYTAIAEESGLLGTLGLLALVGLLLIRSLRAALLAPHLFRRLCAAGLASYLGIQTLLIAGGNLRLVPLTGVTLPFVSYGGSSLLTSFAALLLLLRISNPLDEEPALLANPRPYYTLGAALLLGVFSVALANGWWAVVRGPSLLTRLDNPRRIVEDRFVPRGKLVDRNNSIIDANSGKIGALERLYAYPDLAPVSGYNHAKYGQAGLEATLDAYLRGLQGTSAATIWWDHLLYGMAPPGLDVRLTIDLTLQSRADELLRGYSGAALVLNATTGEILTMASHPTFDPNQLAETGDALQSDPKRPLINRATQGLYPTGSLLDPFAQAVTGKQSLTDAERESVYEAIGFQRTPQIQLPTAQSFSAVGLEHFHVTPLQAALAAAALSAHGIAPAPNIASAVNTPADGWVALPVLGASFEALNAPIADETAQRLIRSGDRYWSHRGRAVEGDSAVAWFIAGAPPNWGGVPIVVVVLIEEDNPQAAERIGSQLIAGAMNP